MHLHCLGLNHRTAPVEIRERLAFGEEAVRAALARIGCGELRPDSVSEMVILSTCNRVEVYAVAPQPAFAELEAFLSEARGVETGAFHTHLYRLLDKDAVHHLFRVAAGLDSMVIGEPQILGQVTRALELARGQGTVGSLLSRLFQAAIHAGKRARTETAISHNPASVASVAARLAARLTPDIPQAQVVVLGAGEMAELVVESLRKQGAQRILVVNRTLERARLLADRWHGQAATFEQMEQALAQADIVITSTGAPHTLIHPPIVEAIMAQRPDRPLTFIDIALPRDVDPAVNDIPFVAVHDLDALQTYLETSLEARAHEIPHVERILAEEEARFLDFLRSLDVIPLIAELRQTAEAIRQAELEKTLRRLGDLSEHDRKRLDAMTQAIVKKLLHHPITYLRRSVDNPTAAEYARAFFGLESDRQTTDDGPQAVGEHQPLTLAKSTH